jgi:prevent-host-death family protein
MKLQSTDAVGAFDAKTNLSQLLDRVERGETIVITRHGEPIAKLAPYQVAIDRKQVEEAVKAIAAIRRKVVGKRGGMTLAEIEAAIDEGRM